MSTNNSSVLDITLHLNSLFWKVVVKIFIDLRKSRAFLIMWDSPTVVITARNYELNSLLLEYQWASATSASHCGIPLLLMEIKDVLLTAFHASSVADAIILMVTIFLSSVALWNGGPCLFVYHFNQHMSHFYLIANISILSCVDELYQN